MAAVKHKHGQRAPRFRYDHQNTGAGLVRFARGRGRPMMTRIYDISESGIAILVSFRLAPQIGEVLRLEFAPPGAIQIACMGRVVRIEEQSPRADWRRFPDTVKIGIAFVNMPSTYKKLLAEGISQSMGYKSYQKQFEAPVRVVSAPSQEWIWIKKNIGSIIMSIGLLVMLGFFIDYVQKKAAQNERKQKSAWAENFFEKVIPEKPSR